MCHRGNDAPCQLEAGVAWQGSSAMVFWAYLFPLLSPIPLFLSWFEQMIYLFLVYVGRGI